MNSAARIAYCPPGSGSRMIVRYPFLFWLAFASLSPVTLAQGLWLRLRAPRMPALLGNAEKGQLGNASAKPTARLLVVGESTAMGVGCETGAQSVGLQLAERIAARDALSLEWQTIGGNGLRARQLVSMLAVRSPQPRDEASIALVLLGVNDAVGLSSRKHWQDQLVLIRSRLRERGVSRIYLAPVPPMGQFTLLPRPLRWVLGWRARMLESARLDIAAHFNDVKALHTDFPDRQDLLASDGYHPGPGACALWADELVAQVESLTSPGRATREDR
ncbi:MAG: SGNH/GDSL hydrolase family protein [Pseudomonadota bacterium]